MKKNNKHKIITGIKKRLQIIAILSVIAFVLGQLGKIYWIFDLFSHFTWLYLIGSVVGIFVFKHLWQKIFFIIISIGLIIWSSWPQISINASIAGKDVPQKSVRLISYNLQFDAYDRHNIAVLKLRDEMLSENTILFMSEYTPEYDAIFTSAKSHYQCGKMERSPFGLALYSSLSFIHCNIIYPIENLNLYPYVRAENESFVVYGIHPPPPINSELANIRDQSLWNISENIRNENKPVIVIGDMNISPYSPVFHQFINNARLFETKNRLIPTWLIGMLNIDHILLTDPEHIDSEHSYIGWWRGSDHRPIFLNYRYD